jgi:chromate transport protein ChrA
MAIYLGYVHYRVLGATLVGVAFVGVVLYPLVKP